MATVLGMTEADLENMAKYSSTSPPREEAAGDSNLGNVTAGGLFGGGPPLPQPPALPVFGGAADAAAPITHRELRGLHCLLRPRPHLQLHQLLALLLLLLRVMIPLPCRSLGNSATYLLPSRLHRT